MKWQQGAAIFLIIIASGTGLITYTDLFGVLFDLTGVEYTFTGDQVCGEECESYINITTSYWRICFAGYNDTKYENEILFKKVSRSRTLHVNLDKVDNIISTAPNTPVDWLVPAVGAGNWRPIQDGDCWERGKVNKIKLVGHKTKYDIVKWSFKTGDIVDIDPLWTSVIVDDALKEKIVYYNSVEVVPYNCLDKINETFETPEMLEELKKIEICYENIIVIKNYTIYEKIGYDIELVDANYGIIGECCKYYEVSPYKKFIGEKVISCTKILNGICNPLIQQTSDDVNIFDEYGIIYVIESDGVKETVVGSYPYISIRGNEVTDVKVEIK